MAHSFTQFLYFIDDDEELCEFIQGERLMAYLRNVGVGCGQINVSEEICQWADLSRPLNMNPCSDPQWESLGTYTTPGASSGTVSPAPWWDGVPGSPSSQALGIWVEEWTGMDGAHHRRATGNRGGRRAGGSFGAMFSGFRTWKLNVILVGQNEPALEELFRWMESTLLNYCDPCGGSDAYVRTVCPPDGDPGFGLWRYRGIALLEGPTWEDDPLEDMACTLRRASFTLGVSDPCMYSCPEVCVDEESFPAIVGCIPWSHWIGCGLTCEDFEPYRLCCPVQGTNHGIVSPIVTIHNGGTGDSVPTRIYGMADPLELGCDPCLLDACQDVKIASLPAGSTLQVDAAQRRILYKDVSTNQTWVDGTPFIVLDPGRAPNYLALACSTGWVAVEPSGFCPGNVEDLVVSVQTQQIVGCARG